MNRLLRELQLLYRSILVSRDFVRWQTVKNYHRFMAWRCDRKLSRKLRQWNKQ